MGAQVLLSGSFCWRLGAFFLSDDDDEGVACEREIEHMSIINAQLPKPHRFLCVHLIAF